MLQCEVQCELSITDEEKQQLLVAAANFSLDNRPFLASLFSCLDYSDNDYFQLFALCLFYAMQVTSDQTTKLMFQFGKAFGDFFSTFK